ncbi:T9SS C-terminal target domain-containing protein, partial [candidate division KSB1 bacterium]
RGYHSVTVDASHLPSGIYLYRLGAGDFSDMKKLILLR